MLTAFDPLLTMLLQGCLQTKGEFEDLEHLPESDRDNDWFDLICFLGHPDDDGMCCAGSVLPEVLALDCLV